MTISLRLWQLIGLLLGGLAGVALAVATACFMCAKSLERQEDEDSQNE